MSAVRLPARSDVPLTPHTSSSGEPLLEVDRLVQRFRVRRGVIEAVSDVSFTVSRGETLGMVGESGSGKSSTGMAVLGLPRPTEGSVRLAGRELTTLPATEMRRVRRRMQPIFQDPVSSLNPIRRVRDIVVESLVIDGAKRRHASDRAGEFLERVGLDIDVVGGRRPHELSGGQCQRVAIARALALQPDLLICDEPVASLDVSIQGQVLNLLEDMREAFGLAMLFISHDLSVVRNVADRLAVMYLGKIVEIGPTPDVIDRPAHPYTRALLDSMPTLERREPDVATTLQGEIPSPMRPPSGCRFRTRCPRAEQRCAAEVPAMTDLGDGRSVACHFPLVNRDPVKPKPVPVTVAGPVR